MTWVYLSLLSALSLSTADALSKKALKSDDPSRPHSDDYTIVWVREGYALPFLVIPLFFITIPALDTTFWFTVALLLPLEITALILYVKALRVSPLSLSIPFMALSPVFIIFIAFALLGELPDRSGVAGIALIAVGAYLLNARESRHGPLGPIKAVLKEPGSVLMIAVALIYAVTSTLGKVAVQHSGPLFFGFLYPLILTVPLTLLVAIKGGGQGLGKLASRPRTFVLIGFFTAVMIITHFVAINQTDVAYMISLKRTSLIFSVLYGKFLFKEVNIGQRLLGSALMASGVVLITLS